MNILSEHVEITGDIKFSDALVIGGKVAGQISSDGALTVGENADIHTRSVTLLGTVHGNISVLELCELKASAHLVGDLKAARLIIEEGASFVGSLKVNGVGSPRPK